MSAAPPAARLEKKHSGNGSGDDDKPAASTEAAASTTEAATTTHPITPAEYIYNKIMIPPSNHRMNPEQDASETVEVLRSDRARCDTGGSSRSLGGMSLGSIRSGGGDRPTTAMMSTDLFLTSDDFPDLDGGIGALAAGIAAGGGGGARSHLKSSDFVEQILLPDAAATAMRARNGGSHSDEESEDGRKMPGRNTEGMLPDGRSVDPTSLEEEGDDEDDGFCPARLSLQLERLSTGDSIVPLNKNFRISSKDWVKDVDLPTGAMHPDMFMDRDSAVSMQSVSNIQEEGGDEFVEYQVPIEALGQPLPPLSSNDIINNLPTVPQAAHAPAAAPKGGSPASSTKTGGTSRKRRKKRVIDESVAIEPTPDDVLFGRGGFTNSHPGNIRFRAKALELRPWYEQSTKEEKYEISELLIESVKSEGHRFLERGTDGNWHEVIGNGARKKASQALRERIRGTRRGGGGGGGGGGSAAAAPSRPAPSAAPKVTSADLHDALEDLDEADVGEFAEEFVGDLPSDVVGV